MSATQLVVYKCLFIKNKTHLACANSSFLESLSHFNLVATAEKIQSNNGCNNTEVFLFPLKECGIRHPRAFGVASSRCQGPQLLQLVVLPSSVLTSSSWSKVAALAPSLRATSQLAKRRKKGKGSQVSPFKDTYQKLHVLASILYLELGHRATARKQRRLGNVVLILNAIENVNFIIKEDGKNEC